MVRALSTTAITLVTIRHFIRSFTAPLSSFAPVSNETHV